MPDDRHWMSRAVELARRCPPSPVAYSVGAVIVAASGLQIAAGHSREGGDPRLHAEESALAKLAPEDPRLDGATMYSTLEPCSRRASGPVPCARLILATGIGRVVIAWREPPLFVADCQGREVLAQAGVIVDEMPEFTAAAREPNQHLVG